MSKRILLLLVLLVAGAGMVRAAQTEYIIVSGGVSLHEWEKYKAAPHDGWWLNFIRAARIRIQQIEQQPNPNQTVTWFVYSPAYKRRQKEESQDLFSIMNSVGSAYPVKMVYFSTTKQLVDYINGGQPRDRVKISGFEYFGHSNKACFMFDYSNEIDSASKVWLHENELGQIRKGIFAPGAHVKSWGCHTGESMNLKWKKATGVPMEGAVGKTQYQTHDLPALSSATGRWVE